MTTSTFAAAPVSEPEINMEVVDKMETDDDSCTHVSMSIDARSETATSKNFEFDHVTFSNFSDCDHDGPWN